jgi:hypothetical protein
MATVTDIINQAFEFLGVTQPGESVSSTVRTSAFNTLNQVISGASAEWPMIYLLTHLNATISAGTDLYTVGTAGSIVTATRPVRITGWQSFSGNFQNGGRIVSFEELRAKQQNNTGKVSVLAEMVAADQNFPLINLQVYPIPATSPGTLRIDFWSAIPQYATVGDTVTLPDGYEQWLVSALGAALAPTYARVGGIPPAAAARIQNDKQIIVQKNAAILGLGSAPSQP